METSAEPTSLQHWIDDHLDWLVVANYARSTVGTHRRSLQRLCRWLEGQALCSPEQVTAGLLENYQRSLQAPGDNQGRCLSDAVRALELGAIRTFLRRSAARGLTSRDLADAVLLPRHHYRIPRTTLTAGEMERVLAQPVCRTTTGLRDRAALETFYATGIRRLELIKLEMTDVDPVRRTLLVRQGKGGRDRVVPLGHRGLHWIEDYILHARPRLGPQPPAPTLFLTRRGRQFRPNRLSESVHRYVEAARIGKHGSCHMFRHTMATLLLEGGADIRHIQAILGHAHLSTTAIYTRVSIPGLCEVLERAHPGERAWLQQVSQRLGPENQRVSP